MRVNTEQCSPSSLFMSTRLQNKSRKPHNQQRTDNTCCTNFHHHAKHRHLPSSSEAHSFYSSAPTTHQSNYEHFHLLRHTYATMLVKNQVEPKVVQDLMRHADINTTLSLYTHLEDEEKKATLDSVFHTIVAQNDLGVERVSKMAKNHKLS